MRSEGYRTTAERLRKPIAYRDGAAFGAADAAAKQALLEALGIRP